MPCSPGVAAASFRILRSTFLQDTRPALSPARFNSTHLRRAISTASRPYVKKRMRAVSSVASDPGEPGFRTMGRNSHPLNRRGSIMDGSTSKILEARGQGQAMSADQAVGDGDAVGAAQQVGEHGVRHGERLLGTIRPVPGDRRLRGSSAPTPVCRQRSRWANSGSCSTR